MRMHFGLIATRTSPQEFINVWNEIWPEKKIVESHSGFQNSDAFWQWMDVKAKFVSSADWTKENPGIDTYAIWKDGEWSVLLDQSYVLASDDKALSEVSNRFGTTLSFIVETTGGTAFFCCYENGVLVRKIECADGRSALTGAPLAQEAGINVESYYMEETEALLLAFGLSTVENFPRLESTMSLAVADEEDYGEMLEKLYKAELKAVSTPWWKFW